MSRMISKEEFQELVRLYKGMDNIARTTWLDSGLKMLKNRMDTNKHKHKDNKQNS